MADQAFDKWWRSIELRREWGSSRGMFDVKACLDACSIACARSPDRWDTRVVAGEVGPRWVGFVREYRR